MQKHSSLRGFTIIELLVTITIIGLITTLIVLGTRGIQRDARDARRIEDVREITKALELHNVAKNRFPIAVTPITLTGVDTVSSQLKAISALATMPQDPLYPAFGYQYQTNAHGTTYTITYCQESNKINGSIVGCTNTISP